MIRRLQLAIARLRVLLSDDLLFICEVCVQPLRCDDVRFDIESVPLCEPCWESCFVFWDQA